MCLVLNVLFEYKFPKLIDTDNFSDAELQLKTDGEFSDFRFNLHLPEVEKFRQFLLNSGPYVRRHGYGAFVRFYLMY